MTRLPLLAAAFALALPTASRAEEITVFAAASLKNALDAIAADWQKTSGDRVVFPYGASTNRAKKIQQGAPADLFLSASTGWMDTLATDKLIKPESRRDLLGNSLVLIAAGKDQPAITITPSLDLLGMLKGGKLAMAMVDSVPAGQYGKEALTQLGLWPSVEPSVAQTDNVRAALALVTTAEAPFGIVYASDAIADDQAGDKVTVVGTFPESSHAPITYPVALTATAKPEAQAFLDALTTDAAKAVFEAQGFTVLK